MRQINRTCAISRPRIEIAGKFNGFTIGIQISEVKIDLCSGEVVQESPFATYAVEIDAVQFFSGSFDVIAGFRT